MNVQERTENEWVLIDELELHTAGSPVRTSWRVGAPALHFWRAAHTAPPVSGFASAVGRLLIEVQGTGTMRVWRPEYREIMVAEPYTDTLELLDVKLAAQESAEPGSPSAAVLLRGVEELIAALSVTQKRLATFLGISPSTVMAWKRDLTVHPRHAQIPTLLRLWAAVAGAQEELGTDETLHVIYASPSRPLGEHADAEALAEALIVAVQASSLAAFETDDGYDSTSAPPLTLAELEAGERELRTALNQYLEGPGAPAPE